MNPAYSSIALAVFCVLSLFLYPCFLPNHSYADEPLPINPSLTIGSSGTLAFDVTPGQFNHGSQSISVATSNYTGYSLTIAPTSGNDTALVNSVTSSTIPSIATDTAESSFSSTSYGFTTDSTITSSTLYKPVTSGTTIKATNAAGTDNFNLAVGAKVASNTPAGTYTRTFTLTAVANPIAFAITYNANAGQDTVTNMPSPNPQTTGEVVGTNLTLSSATPTRTGYKFLGWATTSSATEPTYQPGGSYSLDQTTGNTTTLYAVWAEPLQGWNGCSSLSVGTIKYLYDTRDNQTYRVTKWYMDSNQTTANARCWMMDNLNLGAEPFVTGVTQLDNTNSNMPTATAISTSSFMNWNRDVSGNTSSYADGKYTTVTASNSGTGSDEDSYGNKYGTLYNYAAVSAGTIIVGANANNQNASNSICPHGWRLPIGGNTGEFQALTSAYSIGGSSGVATIQEDFGFSLAGYIYNGSPTQVGTAGYYWSSTLYDGSYMYRLNISEANVNPSTSSVRSSGDSIRCIKQGTTHTLTISYSTGVAGVTIDGIAVANGATVEMEEGVSHTIDMTFSSGYEFDSWSATSGTLGSSSTQATTYTIGSSNATLTANGKPSATQCDNTKLCIEYDGNGLTYASTGLGTNTINYNSSTTQFGTYYSHTSNISDDGTRSGDYGSSLATKDVVTIPGASTLHVTITYGTENSWDMLYVFQGEYTGSVTRNMSAGQLKTYQGGSNTTTTVIIDIPGDTATFAFYSDGSVQYYGYYAVVTALPVYARSIASGEYLVPSTSSTQVFHGWSTNSSAKLPSEVEYANESEVKSKLSGDEGDAVTLYAVWQQGYNITFSFDSNVSSLDIISKDGNAVSTITTSGTSVRLIEGNSYIIKITHTSGYATNSSTKTSGPGTLTGNTFIVGNGDATVNITSKVMPSLQNFNCSTLAVGEITEAYDERDNQSYRVAKWYMDTNHTDTNARCWMMDNLNLGDIDNNPLVVSTLNSSNTHLPTDGSKDIDVSTFNSWKKNMSTTYSYTSPILIPITTANSENGLDADAYGNKYGTLYNYSAASANTYVYENGSGTGNGQWDLCPAGWRLPTTSSSGEFKNFINAYSFSGPEGITTLQGSFGFPLSGRHHRNYTDGYPHLQGQLGDWWGSTFGDASGMYTLILNRPSQIDPVNVHDRRCGYSIRCIKE